MKKYLFSTIYIFITIFILTFIITIFNYFNLINFKLLSVLKLLIPIIAMIINSFLLGKKSLRKGYIEGIKVSLIFIFITTLLNLLFVKHFNIYTIIFYIIIIIISMLGSMIGINRRKEET